MAFACMESLLVTQEDDFLWFLSMLIAAALSVYFLVIEAIQLKKADSLTDYLGWENISDVAKDLIAKLLERQADERLTAEEAYNHPWLAEQR